jgi:hypothetical protein
MIELFIDGLPAGLDRSEQQLLCEQTLPRAVADFVELRSRPEDVQVHVPADSPSSTHPRINVSSPRMFDINGCTPEDRQRLARIVRNAIIDFAYAQLIDFASINVTLGNQSVSGHATWMREAGN